MSNPLVNHTIELQSAPEHILVSSTYDGMCVRISWDAPSSFDGLSGYNIYESATELSPIKIVGFLDAPGLTFFRTPSSWYGPFSGGGRMQDSYWWYRISTVSCYGESSLSIPTSEVNEYTLDQAGTFNGTSWSSIFVMP